MGPPHNEDMEGRFRMGLLYIPPTEDTRTQDQVMLTRP